MFGKQFGAFSLEMKSIATFSASNNASILPRALFLRLVSRADTSDDAKDTYIIHSPPTTDAALNNNIAEADEGGLIENLKELNVKDIQ